jgi:hypothetical protein
MLDTIRRRVVAGISLRGPFVCDRARPAFTLRERDKAERQASRRRAALGCGRGIAAALIVMVAAALSAPISRRHPPPWPATGSNGGTSRCKPGLKSTGIGGAFSTIRLSTG